MRRASIILTGVAVLFCMILTTAPAPAAEETKPASDAEKPYLKANPDVVAKWRQLKFGMFIHWGPVSLTGQEIGWSRGGPRQGHRTQSNPKGTPVEVYDNLYKKFNPTKFDATEWVDVAKDAGMRYVVFTTKHHDGFVMFDSKLTDYKITSPESPYRKDIVKQLADACHAEGLWWGCYYSPPDWHHPDYRNGDRHAKYINYMHGQVRELLASYGRVDILWFDGLGGTVADWNSEPMFHMIRSLQPQIIVNNRAGLPADYDTPEQHIGKMQTDRPWETCMTICRQWSWKPDDRMKTLKECLQTLIKVVGGDGNLLLNVGPMPDGRIEPRQIERLREMGQWLDKYGESIYDTRGGPFQRGPWGTATQRGDTIYLHLLDPAMETVTLPPIQKKILSSSVLTGGTATVRQTDESIEVSVPKADRHQIDTIVVLKLDGPAAEVNPGRLASGSVAVGRPATASNVFQKMTAQYGPEKAVDDDPETRWATDYGTHQAWLEVDLGQPTLIDSASISEYTPRIQKYELQARDGDAWKTFHTGTRIADDEPIRFKPITAQVLRLNILQASEGPTIWEFQLLEKK